MPVNKKKMAAMKQEYGAKKGKQVYYATENKAKSKKKKKPDMPMKKKDMPMKKKDMGKMMKTGH